MQPISTVYLCIIYVNDCSCLAAVVQTLTPSVRGPGQLVLFPTTTRQDAPQHVKPVQSALKCSLCLQFCTVAQLHGNSSRSIMQVLAASPQLSSLHHSCYYLKYLLLLLQLSCSNVCIQCSYFTYPFFQGSVDMFKVLRSKLLKGGNLNGFDLLQNKTIICSSRRETIVIITMSSFCNLALGYVSNQVDQSSGPIETGRKNYT